MTKGPQPKMVPDLLGICNLMFDDDLFVQEMWFLTQPPSQLDHKVCPEVGMKICSCHRP